MNEKRICIIGAGGSGRETLLCIIDAIKQSDLPIGQIACFMDQDERLINSTIMGVKVISFRDFDPNLYKAVVAVGNPKTRKQIVDNLPKETEYTTVIHPSAIISEWVQIGAGSIIAAGVVMTCNIKLGVHTHLNINTTITHDCSIGDYFTTAPGVNISGNCIFGDNVYLGSNACVKQGIKICNDVTLGMGSTLVKDITESGVYVGIPAKRVE